MCRPNQSATSSSRTLPGGITFEPVEPVKPVEPVETSASAQLTAPRAALDESSPATPGTGRTGRPARSSSWRCPPSSDRACATFPFAEGEYGVVWNAARDRKLYLIKEWNVPAWADGPEDGRYSVKGTDAVSAVWMMSEANALKIALALVQADFDAHPEWEAFVFNVVHDEINAECAEAHKLAVAKCVFDAMQEGLRRAGLKSIPTCALEDKPENLIVSCWADK